MTGEAKNKKLATISLYICRWLTLICMGSVFTAAASEHIGGIQIARSPIEGISEHRLPNGLCVVLAQDNKAQSIAFNLVYLIGSLADQDAKGGTAHLVEHMLFKGTATLPGSKLVSEMTRRGIRFNATTSHDRTRYQATLPADPAHLDWMLAMEADRMANTRFEQIDLDKEIPVVLREMEISQSNPVIAFSQRLYAVEDAQGYGRHPLGTRGEVEKLTLQDVRDFYSTYYRPDNAVLVLSGKFDPDQALASIHQHFGGLAVEGHRAGVTRKILPNTPSERTARLVSMQRGDASIAALAYPIPAGDDPSGAEFGVLQDILAGIPHGRLHQALVTQGKAIAVAANPLALRGIGMFFFSATLGQGQTIADAQSHMREVIEQLDQRPITEPELKRAQMVFRSIQSSILADPIALGNVISEGAATGNWRAIFQQLARVEKLSPGDVQAIARRYLTATARISGEMIAETTLRSTTPASLQKVAPKAEVAGASVAGTRALPSPERSKPMLVGDTEIEQLEASIQRFTLNAALKVALLPKATTGNRIQGRLKLRFGDEQSLFGKRQISDLTANMLVYGTRRLTQQQLVDKLNSLGAGLAVIPEDDHVSVRFEAPHAALPEVLDLIAEVLREPAFPEKVFDLLRQQLETRLKQQRNAPSVLVNEELRRRTSPFPIGDVRRSPSVDESLAGMATLTLDDLLRFHADFYNADHGEVAIIGDFDAGMVRQRLEKLFGNWTGRLGYQRPSRPFYSPDPGTFHIAAPGKDHGQYLALLRLPLRDDRKESLAISVASQVLGEAALVGRLANRLRAQEGISYGAGVSVNFSAWEDAGNLLITATYPPLRRKYVSAIVREELQSLLQDGVTPEELKQAKETLLTRSRQSRQQDGAILNQLMLQARTDRSMQFQAEQDAMLDSMTIGDVNAAIRQYVDPSRLVEVLADADTDL